ncbi:MAG: hypothetical protein AAGC72_11130 [Planctomycetota bacterium]
MATWEIDKTAMIFAISKELNQQGVDANGEGEASTEQLESIRDGVDLIAFAFATDFDCDRQQGNKK